MNSTVSVPTSPSPSPSTVQPISSGSKATFLRAPKVLTDRVSSEEATRNVSPLPSNSTSDTYISSLSPKERKAYMIAKSHLDMSFDVEKSIGYKQFVQKSNNQT
jgi:hypothetical protein